MLIDRAWAGIFNVEFVLVFYVGPDVYQLQMLGLNTQPTRKRLAERLAASFGLRPTANWLEQCATFLVEDTKRLMCQDPSWPPLNFEKFIEGTKQQLLAIDWRKPGIAQSVLPANPNQLHETRLAASSEYAAQLVCLQIVSIREIGASSQSALDAVTDYLNGTISGGKKTTARVKTRNAEELDLFADEYQSQAVPPLAKGEITRQALERAIPRKMLKLDLTDGTGHISAIEYSLIPSLSLKTPPGTKVGSNR